MKVKDVMTKNVISIGPEDTLSAALAKMRTAKVHQLVVLSGKEIIGIIEAKNIVTKNIDASKAKVNSFIKNVPKINPNMDAKEAAQLIIKNGLRAVPVVEKGLVGIVSETDLLKIEKAYFGDYRLRDIMTPCMYVDADDDVDKVDSIMVRNNVSRLPVFYNNKLTGIIDVMDLIKTMEGKKKPAGRGGLLKEQGVTEKSKIKKTSVRNFMRQPLVLKKDTYIKDVTDLLTKNEEILVEDEGNVYVVTPKDVLEIISSGEEHGVYIQITNLEDEDNETAAKIQSHATNFIKKIGKMINGVQTLTIYIERHRKSGSKIKYSVRCRILTPYGLFASHTWGWNLVSVAQESVDNLETEVMKKYGRVKQHRPRR